MLKGLKRDYGNDPLHFLTCSCYHEQPWLGLFPRILGGSAVCTGPSSDGGRAALSGPRFVRGAVALQGLWLCFKPAKTLPWG